MSDYGHNLRMGALERSSKRLETLIDELTQSTPAERREALDRTIAERLAEHAQASFGPLGHVPRPRGGEWGGGYISIVLAG